MAQQFSPNFEALAEDKYKMLQFRLSKGGWYPNPLADTTGLAWEAFCDAREAKKLAESAREYAESNPTDATAKSNAIAANDAAHLADEAARHAANAANAAKAADSKFWEKMAKIRPHPILSTPLTIGFKFFKEPLVEPPMTEEIKKHADEFKKQANEIMTYSAKTACLHSCIASYYLGITKGYATPALQPIPKKPTIEEFVFSLNQVKSNAADTPLS